MPSTDERDRYVLIGILVVTAVVALYGVLLTSDLFAWVSVALPLLALYLLWRFVRAHERIAAALETDSSRP